MKREDVEKLLGWAREAQKVFEESGETDFEELRRRLTDRGTEDGATVERRLANAAREMEAAKHYDYIVVNQTVEDAADQLEQIVCAAKHTAKYLREFIDEVEYDAETCCK